jgi:hypothetical protein
MKFAVIPMMVISEMICIPLTTVKATPSAPKLCFAIMLKLEDGIALLGLEGVGSFKGASEIIGRSGWRGLEGYDDEFDESELEQFELDERMEFG